MNLKLFCAVERINDATISPAQSDDCQDDLKTVMMFWYFPKKKTARTKHTHQGLTHLGPEPRKVIWESVNIRFCRKNGDQCSEHFLRQPVPRRVTDHRTYSIVSCEISGDEIKRRGNLRWRGNLRSGCLGLGPGLLHPHERNVEWSSSLDHREWE